MLSTIWLGMMSLAVFIGLCHGTLNEVVAAISDRAQLAVQLSLTLVGILAFWLGIMRIAEAAGLVKAFARAIQPAFKYLFPDIPKQHEALGHIAMNMAANILGLGNAATPFGLRAMEALQTLNQDQPDSASDSMCMFLAINTSSIQLVPVTGIAFLAANGAKSPTDIVVTALLATSVSTLVGITGALIGRRWSRDHTHAKASMIPRSRFKKTGSKIRR